MRLLFLCGMKEPETFLKKCLHPSDVPCIVEKLLLNEELPIGNDPEE